MLRRRFRRRTTGVIALACLGLGLCFVFQLDLIELYKQNSRQSQFQAILNDKDMKMKNFYTSFIGKGTSSSRKAFSKKNKRFSQLSDKGDSISFANKRKRVNSQGDAFADAYSSDEHLEVTENEEFLRIFKREDFGQADVTKRQNEDRVKRNLNSHHFGSISIDESRGQRKFRDDSRPKIFPQLKSQNNVSPLRDSSFENLTSLSAPCLIKGIYWTPSMKELLPKGMPPGEADNWLQIIKDNKVTALRPPQWNQCGRPKNGIAQIDGGPTVCARYRYPHNRLILGEVMSYWLSRYLGLTNVPPVALSLVNSSQWSDVYPEVQSLGWQKDQYTALIMWISQIGSKQRSEAFMPKSILKAIKTGQPWMPKAQRDQNECFRSQSVPDVPIQSQGQGVMTDNLADDDKSISSLIQLAQWSTMIVFDYITGNYDRVASMLDGAENENRSEILNDPMRNLPVSKQTGELWLIDNESGLFDAYDLLYFGGKNGKRFHRFHRTLLHTMCVFDETVIDRVKLLYRKYHPYRFLEAFCMKKDEVVRGFPKDSSHLLFEKYLPHRLRDVLDWVNHCQELFDAVV